MSAKLEDFKVIELVSPHTKVDFILAVTFVERFVLRKKVIRHNLLVQFRYVAFLACQF